MPNSATAQTQSARAGPHHGWKRERAAIKRKLEGLYDAIAEGLRSPGLKEKLLALEARVAAIDAELAALPRRRFV